MGHYYVNRNFLKTEKDQPSFHINNFETVCFDRLGNNRGGIAFFS